MYSKEVLKGHRCMLEDAATVKGRYAEILDRGSRGWVTAIIMLAKLCTQAVQPANLGLQVRSLHVADGIPDTGQPVRNKRKSTHEQEEHGGPVFRIAVQLPGHTH